MVSGRGNSEASEDGTTRHGSQTDKKKVVG